MKIAIVGGGTAGWLAAYFISKSQPGMHDITVIESSSIGIIGAGEGSTGILRDVLTGFFFPEKVDVNEFMEKTDSTTKLGIKHVGWSPKIPSYFAPIDASNTAFELDDQILKYVLLQYGGKNIHLLSKLGIQYSHEDYLSGYTAFHFDAFKIGTFFKEKCVRDGVKVIDSVVKDATIDPNGFIKNIILEGGVQLESDFFIDCTGFSRVLIKKLGIGWVSYADVLPMDSAMPFILPYEDEEKFVGETTATALSSGWMWTIPLKTRKGCGYVYDSSFMTPEKAKQEVESYLGKEIEPIRTLSFEAGHVKEFWKNNLFSLGLASSFVEPLEASSIHNTVVQLAIFCKEFLLPDAEKTMSSVNQKIYNKRISFLNQILVDFISLHYQGGREDSEFWRYIKNEKIMTEEVSVILDRSKVQIPGYVIMEGMWGSHSIPLANYILAGMGLINQEQARESLIKSNSLEAARLKFEMFYREESRRYRV
jgi:flavin-dependent dehydrogenase